MNDHANKRFHRQAVKKPTFPGGGYSDYLDRRRSGALIGLVLHQTKFSLATVHLTADGHYKEYLKAWFTLAT